MSKRRRKLSAQYTIPVDSTMIPDSLGGDWGNQTGTQYQIPVVSGGGWGRTSKAGVLVNEQTALSIPPFFHAIDLISSTMGKIPTYLYRESSTGGREKAKNHPIYDLLLRRPNPYQSAQQFKAQIYANAITVGNGFGYIQKDKRTALATDMYVMDSRNCWLVEEWSTGAIRPDNISVAYYVNGGTTVIPYSDVIHIYGLSLWNYLGVSILDAARTVLGLGIATLDMSAAYYKNDCAGSKYLKIMGKPNKAQRQQIQEAFEDGRRGANNAGRIGFITGGAELVNEAPLDQRQTQYIETLDQIAIAISNLTGIPASKLGAKQINASYNSLGQEHLFMLEAVYDRWFDAGSREFEKKLLTEQEKRSGLYMVEYDRDALLRSDPEYRAGMQTEVNNGLKTENEYRHIFNEPDFGPDGDRRRIPTNISYSDLPTYQVPEEPVEAPAPVDQAIDDSPVDEAPVDPGDKLQALTASVVKRLATRIKTVVEKHKGDKYQDYIKTELLPDHLPVMVASLKPVSDRADEIATSYFDSLKEELRSICQDDLDKVDYEKTLVKEVLHG